MLPETDGKVPFVAEHSANTLCTLTSVGACMYHLLYEEGSLMTLRAVLTCGKSSQGSMLSCLLTFCFQVNCMVFECDIVIVADNVILQ